MSDVPSVLERLVERARQDPERVAFVQSHPAGDRVLDYGTLARRVQELGHALREEGFGDDCKIAICMENRSAWPVAFLGTWYAGAVPVPLDTQQDAAVLGRLLEHGDVAACVTSSALRSKVEEARDGLDEILPVLLLEEEPTRWDGEAAERSGPAGVETPDGASDQPEGAGDAAAAPAEADRNLDEPGTNAIQTLDALVARHPLPAEAPWEALDPPEGVGALMYTSGTTGTPKGVMIRRDSIVDNLRAVLRRIHVTDDDHVLSVLPLFHVLPLLANGLVPLYVGARVTFLSELTSERILEAFRRYRVTAFVCVPLFFYRFHDRLQERIGALSPLRRRLAALLKSVARRTRQRLGWNLGRRFFAAAHEPFGPDLRLFLTGGAKMNAEVHEDFLDWGFVLAQGYGLTEATAALTLTPLDDLRGNTVGPPLDNVELRIHEADAEGIGEIWARSPALMEGYYKDPEATGETIEDGWLRTGDLGRIVDGGHLQVTGRAKDVIVLASGKNVYPDEIEHHFEQSELIGEICILGVPDPERRDAERLHAVVVPDLEEARRRNYVNVREMVKWEIEELSTKLSSARRPTSMEIRTEPLPRTTTRKVKRFELLQEIMERREGEGEEGEARVAEAAAEEGAVTEESGVASTVRSLVARRAGVASVSRGDHLDIDLGLESLDRVDLVAELEETFGVSLSDEVAGELQTVGDIVDQLEELLGEDVGAAETTGGERWAGVLEQTPDDVEPFLRRRPVAEVVVFVLVRILRALLSLQGGFRVEGQDKLPRDYPYLLCPNHFSYVDSLMLVAGLPFHVFRRIFFVGYSAYFEGPLRRAAARLLRVVPIDQNLNLEKAMQAAAAGLRKDLVLAIFPEGGRSIDGEVKEFRRGAAILARHLELPIVPVGLWGSYEMWPRGGPVRPHPLAVAFGEPIGAAEPTSGTAGDRESTERLHDRVVELVERASALYER